MTHTARFDLHEDLASPTSGSGTSSIDSGSVNFRTTAALIILAIALSPIQTSNRGFVSGAGERGK